VPLRKPHVKRTSTATPRISRAKIRKNKLQNQPQRVGEPARDPSTLQSRMTWAIALKLATLASRQSELDERRHVIEMRRHFPHGRFGPM
jgi:hypothetical protein